MQTIESGLNLLQENLIKALEKNGAMTRADMVKTFNKPRTTIYDNLSVLIRFKLVRKFSRQINNRGRPVVFFKLME